MVSWCLACGAALRLNTGSRLESCPRGVSVRTSWCDRCDGEHANLGVDSLVKRLPPLGKKICLVVSLLLMLFATWLFLQGSWEQTNINLGNAAPVSGMPVGIVYAAGIIFSVSVLFILLAELYRVLSGKATEKASSWCASREQEQLEELAKQLARSGDVPASRTSA